MKKKFWTLILPLLLGVLGSSKPITKVLETKADTENRILTLDKGSAPAFWLVDETFLFYWSDETGNKTVPMDKVADTEGKKWTVTIPGTLLNSSEPAGFTFYVDTRDEHNHPENEIHWITGRTILDNGHDYFRITSSYASGAKQTTVSSFSGDGYTVTKHNGVNDIDTEIVPKDLDYIPSFVYQQGYKLQGWYTDEELETPYEVHELNSDIDLYGKYVEAGIYNVYFKKPASWDLSKGVNAYYFYTNSDNEIPLGAPCNVWPGDPMTEIWGGAGYIISVDGGYNPNKIIFNGVIDDKIVQTNDTEFSPSKVVYSFNGKEGVDPAQSYEFEYHLLKGWDQWDDENQSLMARNYVVGSTVSVAIKDAESVKMSIASQIDVPFSMLTGDPYAVDNYFGEVNGNYQTNTQDVYRFTYDEVIVHGESTGTKIAQISEYNSSVTVKRLNAYLDQAEKVAAINQRIADINTCQEYDKWGGFYGYEALFSAAVGPIWRTLINEQSKAKVALIERYQSFPPTGQIDSSTGSEHKAATLSDNASLVLISLIVITLFLAPFVLKKKQSN